MESTKMHKSKTLQLNTLAPILSFGLSSAGLEVPVEVQISILALLNGVVRFFTKGPIGK